MTDTARGCLLSEDSDEQTVRWPSTSQPFVYWSVWLSRFDVVKIPCLICRNHTLGLHPITWSQTGAQNRTEILVLIGWWQEFSLPKGTYSSNFKCKRQMDKHFYSFLLGRAFSENSILNQPYCQSSTIYVFIFSQAEEKNVFQPV